MVLAPSGMLHAADAPNSAWFDLKLSEQGAMQGQLLDVQGSGKANVVITLSQGEKTIAKTRTADDGRFVATGLKSGPYAVSAEGIHYGVRAWSPATAPPSAQPGMLIVSDTVTMRGNIHDWVHGNCLIAVGVVGIIAILWAAIDHRSCGGAEAAESPPAST